MRRIDTHCHIVPPFYEDAVRAAGALNATLDREEPVPKDGDPLPPGWHHLFVSLTGLPLTRELGPDGRNTRGRRPVLFRRARHE